MTASKIRDHGGGLDAAITLFGGQKVDWLDLSTGINPVAYPIGDLSASDWGVLPDRDAVQRLENAARKFWHVPSDAEILAAPGLSSIIARLPAVLDTSKVAIPGPTYNEYRGAFSGHGWEIADGLGDALVAVHPNNPDGRIWTQEQLDHPLTIIDESFCDTVPQLSHINLSSRPGTLILKSFGKFWGLAGLRLGFAIGDRDIIARLADALGPWPVAGPALSIGARALADSAWADTTRTRLSADSKRLDQLLTTKGAESLGGTTLFRLYQVDNAKNWQNRLADAHIWSRVFPYSQNWLRLGLPGPDGWQQLENAL